MFQKISEASAHDLGPEGSKKPQTYASSRKFWKLLENTGTWAGAAGADQKLLECAGELCSVAWLAGSVAGTVAADVFRGYQTSLGKSWAVCWNCLEPWGSRRAAATKECSRLEKCLESIYWPHTWLSCGHTL